MFTKTKHFIIDMDGTVYLGDTMIPGVDACLQKIGESGRDYYFFSNNSSNSIDLICDRLAKIGLPATRDKVLLSSYVAAEYLLRAHPGKTVYLRIRFTANERYGIENYQNGGIYILNGKVIDEYYFETGLQARYNTDSPNLDGYEDAPKELNFFEKIAAFFADLFDHIKAFFGSLFPKV